MIHIVFNRTDAELIKKVMELDNSLDGTVVQVRDDYAAGPLKDCETEKGWQERLAWWKELLKGSPYENDPVTVFDDRQTLEEIKTKLQADPEEQVWIWAAQNQHDVCGYYWLVSTLKEYQGRVMIIYLNNLPFINEKGQIFYPSWLQEIMPRELLKARKLVRPVTMSEFEVDTDEWKKICDENAIVRSLEGGKKITGKEETFYDSEILKNISEEWQKVSRVLTNTLHRMKIKTGDVFVMWRMQQLINIGKIEVMGDRAQGWKAFDVRKPGNTSGISKTESENITEER
ncbi:MAG: DUF1835 domain-containing protein [Chitinophagaceae bacterium]|jgi:hypothetical protein|nr:DUF1835 domain-containing protein [Chitinophagaceae bacterium]OQY95371.1 MAG: hypothetical protein B6D37_06020 [Sphingobacteriales bacterium UTBCD1]